MAAGGSVDLGDVAALAKWMRTWTCSPGTAPAGAAASRRPKCWSAAIRAQEGLLGTRRRSPGERAVAHAHTGPLSTGRTAQLRRC